MSNKKIFTDVQSRITSEMIDNATDETVLLKYKMVIDANSAETKQKIDEAKAVVAMGGAHMEIKKYTGLIGYKTVLGHLSQRIQYKIRELKHNKKKQTESSYEFIFVGIAKSVLPPEMFEKIRQEAKDRLIDAENALYNR